MRSQIGKIVGAVMGVVSIAALSFCVIWTVRNWGTVYNSLDGTAIYTAQDIQKAEDDTWAKAALNEAEYQRTISDMRDSMAEMQIKFERQKAELNSQIDELNDEIEELKKTKNRVNYIVNGEVVESQIVAYGTTATLPANEPTKTGYDFAGWTLKPSEYAIVDNIESLPVENDIYYYAYFLPKGYQFNQTSQFDGAFRVYTITSTVSGKQEFGYVVLCNNSDDFGYYQDRLGSRTAVERLASSDVANFWQSGNIVFYSDHHGSYRLNLSTGKWDSVEWTFENGTSVTVFGNDVWHWKGNTYYSNGDGLYIYKGNFIWHKIQTYWGESEAFDPVHFRYGRYYWSVDDKLYYSDRENHYEVLNANLTNESAHDYREWVFNKIYLQGSFTGSDVWSWDGHAYTGHWEIDIDNGMLTPVRWLSTNARGETEEIVVDPLFICKFYDYDNDGNKVQICGYLRNGFRKLGGNK